MSLTSPAPGEDRRTPRRALNPLAPWWLAALLALPGLAGAQASVPGSPPAAQVSAAALAPAPILNVTPVNASIYRPVTADVSGLDPALTYTLDWGDGRTDTFTGTPNAQWVHTYRQTGTYTVTLSAPETAAATAVVTATMPVPTLAATSSDLSVTLALGNLMGDYPYTLDWGDGSTETLYSNGGDDQRSHAYSAPGTYTISLTPQGGAPATTTVTLRLPVPTVSAATSTLSATLTLGNLLTNGRYTIAWGDGATEPLIAGSGGAQLSHTYAAPGTYPVLVTPQGGAPVTTPVTLTVPAALLTVLPPSVLVHGTVTANLAELTPGLTYTLNWGDSTSETITGSATAQKTHTYSVAGTYAVTLTSPGTTPVTATVAASVPVPTVTASESALSASLTLGNLLSGYAYAVAWGDGTTETLTPTAATAQLSHTYAAPGTYPVLFTPQGGTPVTTTVTLNAPNSQLLVTPGTALVRQTVTANLTTLTPALTYTLNWGDGTSETVTGSATAQKTHTYSAPGTYTVTLTSPGTTPVTATVTATVPVPTLAATSSALTATLALGNLLDGYSYAVTWGDGTTEPLTPTAGAAQLTHTYSQAGPFTVQVTPQAAPPVTATVNLGLPTAILSATAQRLDVLADLANLVLGQPYTLSWGDGMAVPFTAAAVTTSLRHTFAQPGAVTVSLTASGMTPVTAALKLSAPPALEVGATNLSASASLSALVVGLTYTLDWGDGVTELISAAAPQLVRTHSYARPATYTVRLSLPGGDSASAPVTVAAPAASLTLPPTAALGQPVTAVLTGLVPSLTYTLDWGDGNPVENVTGTATASLSHIFVRAGIYLAGTFTVTLSGPGLTPAAATVTVGVPVPELSTTQDGLTVTLSAGNLIPVPSLSYAYQVDWGDGTSEAFASSGNELPVRLVHRYAGPGSFRLVVTPPAGGAPASTSVTLSVGDATLSITPESAPLGQPMTVTASGLVPTLTYTLNWGDGTTDLLTGAVSAARTHAYTEAGTRAVTLSAPGTTTVSVSATTTVPVPTLSATADLLGATLNLGNLLPGYEYGIDWGDGVRENLTASGVTAVLLHTYARAGTFGITVTPVSATPVSAAVTVVAPLPTLQVTPPTLVLGQTVTAELSNLPTGLSTLAWGDGSSEVVDRTAQVHTHTYATPGVFTVSLSVTSPTTLILQATVSVTAPAPVLELSPASLLVREPVTVRLSGLVPALTYTLNWGDGASDTVSGSAAATKTHTYTQPGTYTVTLGAPETTAVTASVTASLPVPTATVTDHGLTITLTLGALLSGDPYTVAWGDAAAETLTPTGNTATLTHTYAQPGTFTVTVARSGIAPITVTATVGAPSPVLLVTPEAALVGQTVAADLTDLIPALTYTLNWDDGTTDSITGVTAARRTHVYLRAGIFNIGTRQAQGYTSRDYLVTVTMPVADLTVGSDRLTGAATLTKLIPVVTYTFDWGDGTPAVTVTGVTETSLTHRYLAAGDYSVLLSASDMRGVRQTLSIGVPAGTLTLSAQNLQATAQVASLETEVTYTLNWGDGTADTITGTATAQKTHTYALPGTYTVSLTSPRVGTASGTVTVSAQAPVLTVSAATLIATAELSGLLPGAEYLLDWGDGGGNYLKGQVTATVTHTYPQPGTYTVKVDQVSYGRLPGILGASAPLTVGLPPRETVQMLSVDDQGAGYHFRVSGLLPEGTYILDYGDGTTERLTGAADVSLDHTYLKSGAYTVTLIFRSYAGDLVRATSVQQVRVALSLQSVGLEFTKPSRDTAVTLMTTDPFEATLSVTYRGGGQLTGRWLIDGQPAGTVDQTLPDAAGRASAQVTFTGTETRPGRHTLTFEFTGSAAPILVRPVTYSLNVPATLNYGGTKVAIGTVTRLSLTPGGNLSLSGSGKVALIVGGSQVGDVNVTFTDQQAYTSGTVIEGPAVTADLGGVAVRNVHLGDVGLLLDRLSLNKDGAALSGSVTLPVPGAASASLSFADAPLAADSGDLLATLRGSPAQNLKLPEDGLSISADTVKLDLSAAQNDSALAEAYKDEAAQPTDWMGLVFPEARLSVGAPVVSQAVTLTRPVAYSAAGYVTTLDLSAGSTGMLGWTVDLTSWHASVVAGRISAAKGAGSVLLPLVNERLNVTLGWNPEGQVGARPTLTSSDDVKWHNFGSTELDLGKGTWRVTPGAASVVFANARWFLDSLNHADNDLRLNNLTMTGSGGVSLDGKPWVSATGTTSLTVLGYPLAAAEVGVERQSDGGYTLGLNGRLQVNEKLPANTTNTKTLFWLRDGKDVTVTTGRQRAANAIYDITLDGVMKDGDLVFTGDGRLKLLGLLEADAKATFGRQKGRPLNYGQDGGNDIGYGSILFHVASGFDKLTVGVNNVEIYELFGGYTVNMDWPDGLDHAPVFRTAGPFEAVQAGITASMLVEAATDSNRQGLPNPPKTYIRGIATGKGGQGDGGIDITGDLWVVPDGTTWDRKTPQGRAKVDITNQGGLLMQGCVGSGAVVAVSGLDCSKVANLQFGSVVSLKGFLEQYAGASGAHLYIGTDKNPISVQLGKDPAGSGYLMIDPGSVRFGVGLKKSFAFEGSKDFFLCTARYGISGNYSQNLDLGIQYSPVVLDGRAVFSAGASVYASCGSIAASVALTVSLDGTVHIAEAESYFKGKASGKIDISGIPDINFSTDVTLKF